MAAMNVDAIAKTFSTNGLGEAFCDLFALKVFLEKCIIDSCYSAQNDLSEVIALSEEGKRLHSRLMSEVDGISSTDARLAIFVSFANDELYVDIENTSASGVATFINDEILAGRIKFPWIFETTLYDKYFRLGYGRRKTLDLSETLALLENTPGGVFQLRSFIVGPFGIIKSDTIRRLQPTRTVPLWHCPDLACTSLHNVLMATGDTKISRATEFIESNHNRTTKEHSEWNSYFFKNCGGSGWYADFQLDPLPWLLANAFSDQELQIILEATINKRSRSIREKFPQDKRFQTLLTGSSASIAARLAKPQCLQLLLIEDDKTLANTIEDLIRCNKIEIPWNEIRTPQFSMPSDGWHGTSLQCSKFGIRSISKHDNRSITRLFELIRGTYSEKSDLSQLEWILRGVKGDTTLSKLSEYIHNEDPYKILSETIFNSPKNYDYAIAHLKYGDFSQDQSQLGEVYGKQKILWKLGFEINQFPDYQSKFWERYEIFLASSRTYSEYTEPDRESIRSTAVNFFVSLEEILDMSVSFIGWALFSDHYLTTRFLWNYESCRKEVYRKLNASQHQADSKIEFDESGKNTLYPLTKGFSVIADISDKMLSGEMSQYRRPESEIPGFAKSGESIAFPFKNKPILFDVKMSDIAKVISLLRETSTELEKSGLCDIRNRLEHKRSDFPSQLEIEGMCERLSHCIRKLETSGICPVVYIKDATSIDSYGRKKVVMRDYKKRQEIIRFPSDYIFSRLPGTLKPVIILPWVSIGESKEKLRFYIQENSEFIKMWRDYPKRRFEEARPLEG